MTDILEPPLAEDVYSSGLEPRVRGRLHRAVDGALDLWCATTGGRFELTSAGDVVVRRLSDGADVLRVPVGPPPAGSPMLAELAEDLATMSPTRFRDAWGLS